MKLKARINGVTYDNIVAGATFSEEYNETLDSGSIIIDHVPNQPKMRPFDDVYIWDADHEFNGYYNKGDLMPIATTNFQAREITQGSGVFTTRTGNTGFNQEPLEIEGLSLKGIVIDIWNTLIFDRPTGPGEYQTRRFKVPNILLMCHLYSQQNSYISVYKLPTNYNMQDFPQAGIMRLTKDTTTGTYSGPDYIYVSYIRTLSRFEDFLINKDAMGGLTFEGTVFDTLDAQGNVYSLLDISMLSGESYDYEECEDAKTKYDIELQNDSNVTITNVEENLTREKLLTISNLTLTGMIKGRLFEMPLTNVIGGFENSVVLYFEKNFQYWDGENKTILARAIVFLYPVAGETNQWRGTSDMYFWQHLSSGDYEMSDLDYGYADPFGSNFHYYFDTINIDFENALYEVLQDQTYNYFYKHLVIDSYTKEMVDLDRENFKYKIDLKSEISKMEKVILPNLSITQPIAVGVPKRTIKYYLKQYLELYSPKIKKQMGNNKWVYVNKYYLSDTLWNIFTDDVYAPEMTLTAPTLRELLSRLMIVKDCIPYVFNDVIYAIDISKTHGVYGNSLPDLNKHVNFVFSNMDSNSYSTALRREFQGAISQRNTAHLVEYLGFRNPGSALLTLENMQLQTRFPIYKINKMYMCYYRKVKIINNDTLESYDKVIFVKQDITDLVLQNVVRNTLPADWTKYPAQINSRDDMKNYKLLTVGYDIGSNVISGWGEKYSYYSGALAWIQNTYTYIETIMNLLDDFYPFGIVKQQFHEANEVATPDGSWRTQMISPINTENSLTEEDEENNITAKLKTLVFQIDYNAMYSGTIIHTKDNEDDEDYVTTDNSNTSLTLLEVDGLYQKEKVNRFANPVKSWAGRYDSYEQMNTTYNNVLGSVFDDNSGDEPVIVFHREYQIWEDCVVCNFVGMYDYVMKNYYTNVFAKYRTYSYASYNESVERKENDKYSLILSKDNQRYESGLIPGLSANTILSAFEESEIDDKNLTLIYNNQINGAYFLFDDGNEYFSDVNVFVSGYSLCFNIRMFDPLTAGIKLATVNCFNKVKDENDQLVNHYVGASQDWYKMPVESEADGFITNVGCYFGHFKEDSIIYDTFEDGTYTAEEIYGDLLALPYKKRNAISSFGKTYNYCKDNKELLDYTLQYELINYNQDNVAFSDWLMRLSEFNKYIKFTQEKNLTQFETQNAFRIFYGTRDDGFNILYFDHLYSQQILLRFEDENGGITIPTDTKLAGAVNRVPYTRSVTHASLGYIDRYEMYIVINNIRSLDASQNQLEAESLIKIYHYQQTIITQEMKLIKTYSIQENLIFNKQPVGETGYIDYYCVGRFGEEDFSLVEQMTNNKYFPTGEGWNSNLTLSNSNIVYAAFEAYATISYSFPKTMYLVASTQDVEQTLMYPQIKLEDLQGEIIEVAVTDVFNLVTNDNGSTQIQFNGSVLNNITLPEGTKSIQYWYLDKNTAGYGNEYAGDGLLHFVFGVNITRDEETGNINDEKIYISVVKNRNTKVYDYYHNVIGHVANCAEDEEAEYGEQKFVLNEEE